MITSHSDSSRIIIKQPGYSNIETAPAPDSVLSARMQAVISASRNGLLSGKRCHFIGIGGIGMSALARLAQAAGAVVSGSDMKPNDICDRLRAHNIPIQRGHSVQLIADADIVVYSSAIRSDNTEITFSDREGLEIQSRAQMLATLIKNKTSIGISGAHGKTSTTWMTAHLLIEAGFDPSIVVGGIVPQLGENYRLGADEYFIAEIDESDGRMVQTPVDIAVITNIDLEHIDHYSSIDDIIDTFLKWGQHAHTIIGCGDDPHTRRLLDMLGADGSRDTIRYGFNDDNDVCIRNLNLNASGSVFDIVSDRMNFRGLTLSIPGTHTVLNAAAALSVASRCSTPENKIRSALAGCRGVKRRFEVLGVVDGVRIVDDYGHHPTEIVATLQAARPSTEARLVVVFQPHRYTRTLQFADQFADAFSAADVLLVMDVYAASETPIEGVSGQTIIDAIDRLRETSNNNPLQTAVRTPTFKDAVDYLKATLSDGDTLITMGAGDVWRIGHELVDKR